LIRVSALSLLILLSALALPAEDQQPGHSAAQSVESGHEAAVAGQAQEHHEEKKYFGIPAWILQTANMLLFFGFLGYLVRKPVGQMFRGRSETIRTQLTEAKTRREKAERLAEDIQSRLSQIETEVASILQRASKEGDRQKKEMVALAEAEAEKILASAKNEVEMRVRLARKELTEYAGQLAADRAEKILEGALTEADRRKLFTEGLQGLGAEKS